MCGRLDEWPSHKVLFRVSQLNAARGTSIVNGASYSANRTRSRSQPANDSSSIFRAATSSIAWTASSTLGGSGSQDPPLRSTNNSRHAHAARLLPSGSGWFNARRHGRLVVQVGVEVLVSKTGLWRVQCRICQLDAARLDQCRGVETGDLLGQLEELGEVEVPSHSARRSMIAWSRSRSRRARLMKSASDRTRSISVDNESMINWFTLVPCTRATVSASLARSSGSRTVVCLVMQSRYHDIIVDRVPGALESGAGFRFDYKCACKRRRLL
jgi:hypothetical protein